MQGLSFFLAGIGTAGLCVASILTLLDVALRYWGVSVLSLSEIVLLLITASIAALFPLSLQEDHQLAIRYLGQAMRGAWSRILDIFGALATLVFFGIIAWRFVLYALDTIRSGETTPMAAVPIYPTWVIAAAIFVIAVVVQVCHVLRLFRR